MTDSERIDALEKRVAELEMFCTFAQPTVINAGLLWEHIHKREGIRDYFGPIQRHNRHPLADLGAALDAQVKPLTDLPDAPPMGQDYSVLTPQPGG